MFRQLLQLGKATSKFVRTKSISTTKVSTVQASVTLTETSTTDTITLTSTASTTATAYAQCQPDNIISSLDNYLLSSSEINPSGPMQVVYENAADPLSCCVLCAQDPACGGYLSLVGFTLGESNCLVTRPTAQGLTGPGATCDGSVSRPDGTTNPGGTFSAYTSPPFNGTLGVGIYVGNGQCGQVDVEERIPTLARRGVGIGSSGVGRRDGSSSVSILITATGVEINGVPV